MGDYWTDDRVAQAKRLWDKGCTASQIANELGCTRNAVLSKIHRANLAARAQKYMPSEKSTLVTIKLRQSDVAYLDEMARDGGHLRNELIRSIVEMVIADDRAAEVGKFGGAA